MEEVTSEGGVYLLCFNEAYPHGRRPKHYMGYAHNIRERVEAHRRGESAVLMRVIKQAGIGFQVARVWVGEGRTEERKRKNSRNIRRFCPLCRKGRRENGTEET